MVVCDGKFGKVIVVWRALRYLGLKGPAKVDSLPTRMATGAILGLPRSSGGSLLLSCLSYLLNLYISYKSFPEV
jgi:hypothetical protein